MKEKIGDIDSSSVSSTPAVSSDIPTPKPRSVKVASPIESDSDDEDNDEDIDADVVASITASEEATDAPVPKPRSQMKHSDSFKNIAALCEQSDSISLRSLDTTDDYSKTDEPSSVISQHKDFSITSASVDPTEIEPSSEYSIEDDTERSEVIDSKPTSFYIGESSRNIIIKTTPTKAAPSIEAEDILLMKEMSVDSDEANDTFKEYITMQRDDDEDDFKAEGIVRQNSETRNDLLEPEMQKIEEKLVDEEKTTRDVKCFELPLEKSEWETSEKEIPPQGKSNLVHTPQDAFTKSVINEEMVVKTLDEVQESLDAITSELKFVVKDGKCIKESPSEFEFRSIQHAFEVGSKISDHQIISKSTETRPEDISSFIGVSEGTTFNRKEDDLIADVSDEALESLESLNKAKVAEHYKDMSSMGFVSSETAAGISSMEDYHHSEQPQSLEEPKSSMADPSLVFDEVTSDQIMKPFDTVVHRIKCESGADNSNRWSVPDIDSSSSESNYKSAAQTDSRPLSSDVENLMTQANSSDYQTAFEGSSTFREATEYISAVGTLEFSSAKTISSHDSMKSLGSQSEMSSNLGSIDVSELSETLVASSTDGDAIDAEELKNLRDLHEDEEENSEESLEIDQPIMSEQQMQQSLMKRSQEMIFKPKSFEESTIEASMVVDDETKTKTPERTWGLAYPFEEESLGKEMERAEDILLYHGDARHSLTDEGKQLATSLDEGSILSVSMSSTSNIDTVVENFEDMIGSAGSSSLAGVEGFAYVHDSPQEETFTMEIDNIMHSTPELSATTPPEELKKRGHKRNESTTLAGGDLAGSVEAETELPTLGEAKESESESDTDPYESEYSRQFRCPKDRKHKKKKQDAAEMDRGFETEKRPFTPSQLVAEVIVEDILTEELEAESTMNEERRPSQNMQDYSNIPNIMVTEDIQKSPLSEEEYDRFQEKTLYKVKTQEELHKVKDEPLYQQPSEEEENFQKKVQEQYKQKLAEIQRAQASDSDNDEHKGADSPDSFEMVDQPDISDEFVIIEEVAREANEVDLGGKSIKIAPMKYEEKHDMEVEKIIINSAPADPMLGSQIYKDDLNFEFEESPPTASSGVENREESDTGDLAASNKRWVEMQLTDSQLRYPYDMSGGVLEDIKEEDGEFEVGSSRISSFKESFSSTEYDVLAARRYFGRGENDDISMSSLQEFESLEQAISLENRNKGHQGSTDSSNSSFQRRYVVRNSTGGGNGPDEVSVSSLKEFEGLENACIEAHLIEIKAKEEAAMLSRSDESNKSNGNGRDNIVVTSVTQTVVRSENAPLGEQAIQEFLKRKLEECESRAATIHKITELEKHDSEMGSVDSLEINKSMGARTSSIDSFDISKDATTRSDVDSLDADVKQPTREESIESIENEQLDLMSQLVGGGGGTALDGLKTTTTTTTTTSTDANGKEHVVTRVVTTTSVVGEVPAGIELPMLETMEKDISVESLNMCVETTSSSGTTATYQTSAGNSQMTGSATSCASSTLMEEVYFHPSTIMTASGSTTLNSSLTQEDATVLEDHPIHTEMKYDSQK